MESRQAHAELLYKNYLNEEERKLIDFLEKEIDDKGSEYCLTKLWMYDSYLGRVGAYSMWGDPKKNPFRDGYIRDMFRHLQYVRCKYRDL